MPRLRLIDFRLSRGPKVIGLCKENQPGCADAVNSAQRRLLMAKEAGDSGWYGTFAEIAFQGVSRTAPYITCPRSVARLESIDVCNRPIFLNNQFYEYLEFGNGRFPKFCQRRDHLGCLTQAFTRNNVVTFVDQSVFPCILRVYATDVADINAARRVLLQGLKSDDSVIYSQDGAEEVQGVFVDLDTPFADAPIQFNRITGIQKDPTQGDIQIFQVNPNTGDETLLVTMEPGEQVAGYRRYYLNDLPRNCCNQTLPEQPVLLTAIAKLELIPVVVDTDYLLLHNLEAIIEECISTRMSEMDSLKAQQMAGVHHINAVRYLNSEITHYLGKQSPAVGFRPFGSARLERQSIGRML